MAATTTDIALTRTEGGSISYPLAASAHLYAGAFACLNSSGNLVNGADTSGLRFAGIVQEETDNSSGSAGDLSAEIIVEGTYELAALGLAAGDEGKYVFLIDNQTVGLSSDGDVDNHIRVGRILEVVSATKAVVDLEPGHLSDNTDAPLGELRQYVVEVAGVNATTFDLTDPAEALGGVDFYIDAIVAVRAIVTGTGADASPARKVVTTHWTLAAGVLSAVGNETANTWLITFNGKLI